MTITLLSIDPGETTGITVMRIYDTPNTRPDIMIYEKLPYHNVLARLKTIEAVFNPTDTIVENWTQHTTANGTITNRVIGMALALFTNCELVSPSTRNLARNVYQLAKPAHDPDNFSSLLHALSWSLKNNLLTPHSKLATGPMVTLDKLSSKLL